MRLNDLLEDDLRNLKETYLMCPTTRIEYKRKLRKASYDFSSFDEILQQKKSEQLKIMRNMFGS